MFSSRISTFGLAAAATTLVLTGCSGGVVDEGDTTTLTYTTFLTEDHPASQAFEKWMDEVTERTDGEIEFETFYNASLCDAPDSVSCVEDGTADLAMAVPAYTPELTLSNIGSVAFVTRDLQANGDAVNKLYEDHEEFRNELADRGARMVFAFNNSMPVLASANEYGALADLEGESLRASGSMTAGLATLGANPVAVDPAEIYESLERGVVSGATFPIESIVDYKIDEVAPNIYDIGEYMGSYAMNNFLMNSDAYDGLSEDQQAVVDEVSAEISGSYVADFLLPAIEGNCEELGGDVVKTLGPEDAGQAWAEEAGAEQRATWEEAAAAVVDDPTAYFDDYLANLEESASDDAPTTAEICASVS